MSEHDTPPHHSSPSTLGAVLEAMDFDVAPTAHITLDSSRCDGCSTHICVSACPAELFVRTSDGGIIFNYERCFECGTCLHLCNVEGALTWQYPTLGHGVIFHHG